MRFGIGMNTDHTLEEVGLQFSCNLQIIFKLQEKEIRQIETQKFLRKLKHPSRSKQLKSFLEK